MGVQQEQNRKERIEQIAEKVVALQIKIGENQLIQLLDDLEFTTDDIERQKFKIIVNVCCNILRVLKKNVIQEKFRCTTKETECLAFIFHFLKKHTNYRNNDISFLLKRKSISCLYLQEKNFCLTLNDKIARDRELIKNLEMCKNKIEDLIKLIS
jgi:hypothetical protein